MLKTSRSLQKMILKKHPCLQNEGIYSKILISLFSNCMCSSAKSHQSCLTLCGPVDWSLPGSSVHGILQSRILEWVAVPFSRGSSRPRDQAHVSCIHLYWQASPLPLVAPGKPRNHCMHACMLIIVQIKLVFLRVILT